MSLISSSYPPDTENGFLRYLGGIGRAVLGNSSKFFMGRNFTRVNQRVVLMDFSYGNLMAIAQNVPHLNTVISKGAEMFSNMEIKHVNKSGVEIENSDVIKLLNKPNPLQSLSEMMYEFFVYNSIYNANFIYKNYATRINKLPSVLWCLPSGEMKINLTGKIYRQTQLSDIIENYVMFTDTTPFTPDEIILITEGIKAGGIIGGSRIDALQIPLSNIMAALKSQNIILTERGLIGFIASDSGGDSDGVLPTNKEMERAEKDYKSRRSLDSDQGHVTFSSANIKWVPMTFDLKQLMLHEGLEDAFCNICGAIGIDRRIFPSSIVASASLQSGNELSVGMTATYQNTMQPLAKKLLNKLSDEFNLTERGEKLIADYSHMPCMQDDKLKEGQAKKVVIEGLSIALRDGVISHDTYAEEAELEMTGDGQVIQNTVPGIAPGDNIPTKP